MIEIIEINERVVVRKEEKYCYVIYYKNSLRIPYLSLQPIFRTRIDIGSTADGKQSIRQNGSAVKVISCLEFYSFYGCGV